MDSLSVVISMVLMIGILFLAYYATRFLGNNMQGMRQSKHLQVIDRYTIDKDKSILIVKVNDQYEMLGVSQQSITHLKTYEETIQPIEVERVEPISFQTLFEKVKGGLKNE